MRSGVDLIAIERQEQIQKHGIATEDDYKLNDKYQLRVAVLRLIKGLGGRNDYLPPLGWNPEMWCKMMNKTEKERLVIAGALIAAEIDRMQFDEGPKGILLAPTSLTPKEIADFAKDWRKGGAILTNEETRQPPFFDESFVKIGFKSQMNKEDVPDEFTPYGYNVKKGVFTVNHAHFKGTFESASKKYRGYLLGRKSKNKSRMDRSKNLIPWERWVVNNYCTAKTKKINDNE